MIARFAATSCFVVLVCSALGQSAAKAPSFEVASVKPSPPEPSDPYQAGFRMGRASRGLVIEGRRASLTAQSLRDLVRVAYNVKDYQVTAAPGMSRQLFDITATLPEGASPDQAEEMLRTLLAERFHLKVHWEPKELPVYVLLVGKGGIKVSKVADAPGLKVAAETMARVAGPMAGGVAPAGAGVRHFRMRGTSLPKLADSLTRFVDRPVIDQTELSGNYDFELTFAPPDSPADEAPSLFTAVQEQLGLKLEARKLVAKTVVIDSVDQVPTEN